MQTKRTTKVFCLAGLTAIVGLVACGKRGMESEACTTYFAKNEACAAKAPKIKGDVLRATANTSKEGFKANSNPMAIEESCKVLMKTLETDPDCK